MEDEGEEEEQKQKWENKKKAQRIRTGTPLTTKWTFLHP